MKSPGWHPSSARLVLRTNKSLRAAGLRGTGGARPAPQRSQPAPRAELCPHSRPQLANGDKARGCPSPVLPDFQSPLGLLREAGQAAAQEPLQPAGVEAVLPPHLAGARLRRHLGQLRRRRTLRNWRSSPALTSSPSRYANRGAAPPPGAATQIAER